MDALAKNMEGIAGRMQVVNAFLAGKRAKVNDMYIYVYTCVFMCICVFVCRLSTYSMSPPHHPTQTKNQHQQQQVDQLVSVRRLLQRLDFLFALPTTLARCVQKQEYGAAVAYYAKASVCVVFIVLYIQHINSHATPPTTQ